MHDFTGKNRTAFLYGKAVFAFICFFGFHLADTIGRYMENVAN